MQILEHSNRTVRKAAGHCVRKGFTTLRVLKRHDGYRLAAPRNSETLVLLDRPFGKESFAIAFGEEKYGCKAKRLLVKKAA